jgi:type I restriction enzyme, R subunit
MTTLGMSTDGAKSTNFNFLGQHDVQLVRLGALAERYFRDDPNTCLIKLRQFGEVLAQLVAAKAGLYRSPDEPQADLLRRLNLERIAPREVGNLFYQLRVTGNRATHDLSGTHTEALTGLKVTRQLGIWFHRTFGQAAGFKPGPFAPPPDPAAATAALHAELARLREELMRSQTTAERSRAEAEEHQRSRLSAEEGTRKEQEDRAVWEQLAAEADAARVALAAELARLQAAAAATPAAVQKVAEQAAEAATAIDLDEMATRAIIDQQLRDRGWEVDSQTARYALGARPVKNRAMAIAEWPTANGPADYALFIDTQCVALAEAKRRRKNVSTAIDQAERYSKGFAPSGDVSVPGGPWGEFRVPFVFSANGRAYLKQIETESGIWFRDVRRPANLRRALVDWVTPQGLKERLEIDRDAAQAALKAQPFEFGFPLRPYQRRAIETIEATLDQDQRTMLVAMATGTGKTKLAIALLYRLLSAKRFRRICFVVDRNALGGQAADEFKTTRVVSVRTFADIFGLKELSDVAPESETRVHICTIQGLVRRVLLAASPAEVPSIDQYDLMVVDECHRGYLLDREMSDAEMSFRNEEDYISKYRRVLEHFDATKIGLTATPALHTTQIFGDPIFTYSYREAVIDGYLIDHEPPVRIETTLSRAGIGFKRGEELELLDTGTGQIDLAHAPDDLNFAVDEFNKRVVTVPFNATVAKALAEHIDPSLPGKTLIFAVSDAHADIVVDQVKKAMEERYGEIEDAAVKKITGSVDRVGALIKSFRNDALPKIAVTVDLLTTGIDVPRIVNLVFLRRVNSRILYEQMIGRATRPCDEIEKETFRIFDAVDLYPHLQNLTQMKPVVVNPSITLEQLFRELAEDDEDRREIRDQALAKLHRRLRRMPQDARRRYEAEAGEAPDALIDRLKNSALSELSAWVKAHPGLGRILDWDAEGQGRLLPISHHPDELVEISRGYGGGVKPEDFLDGFTTFIRGNVNKIAALTVVVQRPRDLTRSQLRALKLELDGMGYSETALRTAWQDARNEDIAASIVGFIRQAAIGDPLVPYGERVQAAMRRILSSRQWSDPQRRWLRRIGEQLEREIVVDREALDQEPFRADGGFTRLNKVFGGTLENVLSDIGEEIWKKVS